MLNQRLTSFFWDMVDIKVSSKIYYNGFYYHLIITVGDALPIIGGDLSTFPSVWKVSYVGSEEETSAAIA